MDTRVDPIVTSFMLQAQDKMSGLDPSTLTIAELRQQSDLLGGELFQEIAEPGPDVASVTDLDADGVAVKVYRPFSDGPHGAYVILHGGGWWQGSIEDWISDVQCRERCIGGDCVVVSVEYRLAPEHPFPAGLEDSFTAFTWVREHADELGIDPERIVLGGVSAGGNLGAALTLLLRERGVPQPAFALYEAGVMDLSPDHASIREFGVGFGLDAGVLQHLVSMYVSAGDDIADPLVSPLRASSLDGLPPAHLMTCELDPTRDTSNAFADRLTAAGVPVTRSQHVGFIHQSPGMTKVLPAARAWRDEVHRVLGAAVRAGSEVSA